MRNEFISLFAEINAQELETLTRETKETFATDVYAENARPVFTAANLWKIRSMRKTRLVRRTFIP